MEQLTTFPFQQLLSNYSECCSFLCPERAKELPAIKSIALLCDYHKHLSLHGKDEVAVRDYTKTGEPKGRVKFEDLIFHCAIIIFTTTKEISSGGRVSPSEYGSILSPLFTGAEQERSSHKV